MDTQYLSALMDMLSSLGFSSSSGRTMFFYACLRQKEFVIREQISFGEDSIHYQLYFKEDAAKNLTCSYYDATLRKAVDIPAPFISGVDVLELKNRMRAVDWPMSVDIESSPDFNLADKNTWKQESEIEEIITDLEILAATEEGAALANALKYKFWIDTALQSMIPELVSQKNRFELTQRFYIINGDAITAKEAYRFLNNRWMERMILAGNRLQRQNEQVQKEANLVLKGASDKRKSKQLPKANSGK